MEHDAGMFQDKQHDIHDVLRLHHTTAVHLAASPEGRIRSAGIQGCNPDVPAPQLNLHPSTEHIHSTFGRAVQRCISVRSPGCHAAQIDDQSAGRYAVQRLIFGREQRSFYIHIQHLVQIVTGHRVHLRRNG